ncbi:hypothetical protein D4764_0292630 [Takifugu flavidus]|uniref:Uncharacterized protein n=1 Tax=Takifugu flavidus TaxID=433684 RepID=A0A5C6MEK9_9TELE|nr:hypothetical protein D4764_0292630 [Takifugu flavidus]
MAGHRDLRRRRRHLWRPTRPREVTVRDHRWYRHKDQPDPDRPEAPHQGTEPPNPPGQSCPRDSTPSVQEIMQDKFNASVLDFREINRQIGGLLSEEEKEADIKNWFEPKMMVISGTATKTSPTRTDRRLHTKAQSPLTPQARAVHGTAPPVVDRKHLPAWQAPMRKHHEETP